MPDARPKLPAAAGTDPAAAPSPDLTGRTLGDYQILRKLGAGGMGQVYLARQLSLKREVALKLLRDHLTTNATALNRFESEAHAVAKLNHPNIVHIHQLAEADGLRYMVLEFVDGRNLREHLARKGPPDLPVTLSVIRQVALALQKAHEQGIVHRDIKPENILVTRKVEVKVTDFGLSRFFAGDQLSPSLTQSGITLGTPLYMSPEQVQGQPVDHRSDVYSFGVTCYHLLSGEPPFRGATAFDVAIKHVQDAPRPLGDLRPDLPADLCGMVHKMMAKDPGERYQSIRLLLRDLAKVRDGIAVANPPGASAQQQPLSLTLSGVTPTARTAESEKAAPPVRWARWAAAGVLCVAAATAGAVVAARQVPGPQPAPVPQSAAVGLPDIRPTVKFVTTRERELLTLLANRETKGEDVLNGSIELGLLYVAQHRLDDADARFKKLEGESFQREPAVNRAVNVAGRLGQAVVAAYRDAPAAAQQSNDLFAKVMEYPFIKIPGKPDKVDKGNQIVVVFLARHLDLAEAVADALTRNATALHKEKLDTPLELLRHPPRTGKRE